MKSDNACYLFSRLPPWTETSLHPLNCMRTTREKNSSPSQVSILPFPQQRSQMNMKYKESMVPALYIVYCAQKHVLHLCKKTHDALMSHIVESIYFTYSISLSIL